jgi:tripartite-type tricarboxylate transporter receptor subunit TctC
LLDSRELEAKLPDLSAEAGGGSPDEFARFIRAEVGKWHKVVREAGIKVE